eukprot:NODE_6943_length_484_cov_15.577031_g6777_i0.p2 GENE.NODE_6943_length_484_cov_15.577031_g6777_i0~~NODE_6943_length_484_cov_15.577031_g6777_i0.p2  ORF type:complete len:146 (-),score=63.24 NODE_6943_length_484_cov_15.577031_g6777_i0:46-441(-)
MAYMASKVRPFGNSTTGCVPIDKFHKVSQKGKANPGVMAFTTDDTKEDPVQRAPRDIYWDPLFMLVEQPQWKDLPAGVTIEEVVKASFPPLTASKKPKLKAPKKIVIVKRPKVKLDPAGKNTAASHIKFDD